MTSDDDAIEANDDTVEDLHEVWGYDRKKAIYGKVPENEADLRPLAVANSIAMILTAHTSREHVSEAEWGRDAVYSATLVERWTHDFDHMVTTVDELEELAMSQRAGGAHHSDLSPEEYDFEWVVGEFKLNKDTPFVAVGVLQRDGSARLLSPNELQDFMTDTGSPDHYRVVSSEWAEEEREKAAADRLEALRALGPGVAERLLDVLDDEALAKLVEGLRKRQERSDC